MDEEIISRFFSERSPLWWDLHVYGLTIHVILKSGHKWLMMGDIYFAHHARPVCM